MARDFFEKKRKEQEKAKSDQLYRSMLAEALRDTASYARQGVKQTREVADTLVGGGMTSLKRGDVKNLDRDTLRASVIDNATAIKKLSKLGIFDKQAYATDPMYKTLPGIDYLKQLEESLQMQQAASLVADDFAKADKQRTAETETRWQQLFEDKDNPDEAAQWYNWLMADYLLGDRDELFDFEKINSKYEAMDDKSYYAEEDRLRNQFKNLDWETLTGSKTNRYESLTPTYEGYLDTVGGELKRRKTIDELAAIAKANPEYASLSAYNDTYTAPERSMFGQDQYAQYVQGLNDLNRFINVGGTYAGKQIAAEHSPTVAGYLNRGYDYMTDDEIATYNVLYNTDQEKAAAYLEALGSDLLYRRAQADREWTETKATNPYLAVPSWIDARINTLGNIGALPLQAYEAATGKDDPYSAAYDAANKAGYVTGAQMEALGDIEALEWSRLFGKNLAQHLYSGVSSAADNALRAATGPTGALVLAGAQAASGSLQESASRDDMSGAAKIVKAILTAGAEVGTEKVGIDALFDKGKPGALEYIKGVIGAELGEETINYLSEDVIEAAVAFMFDHEADIKSAPEFWQGLGETALQTLISSGLMGSGGAISQANANRATGKQVKTQGDFEAVLDIAAGMDPSTQSYQLAQEAKARTGKGKKISLNKMGQIVNALDRDLSAEQSRVVDQVMDEAIVDRLVELGTDSATAKKNAPAVRKIANGQVLTAGEKRAVAWDDNASQVVKELAAKESTDLKRIEVEGAPTAEPEGQRAGQKWKSDLGMKTFEQTSEVLGKRSQLADAVSTPAAQDVQKAVEAAEKKTSTSNTKAKNMTNKGVSYITETGEAKGEFQRFEMKDGAVHVVVKTGDKETDVKVEDLTDEGGAGTAAIIEYTATAYHNMTAAEANTMMQTYEKVGGNVKKFITDFEAVYAAGYAGIDAPITALKDTISGMVYERAQREAAEAEEKRVERAKALRKSVKGSVAWLGQVEDNSAIRGAGDVEALSGAMEGMTEAQQTTVEVVQALAEELRVNIVLYEGKGKNLGKLANGKYEPSTHTLYVDVNSGAASAEGIQAGKGTNTLGFAMMRTLGHELTHHMESTSAEGYAQYKAAVKKQLQENGQSWAELVRAKIENAADEGRKLTRMGAEAEVVADASEYMLQESSFTKKLDSGLYAKVKSFVQSFMEKVREIFTHITGEHRESAALRKVIDGVRQYTGNLQQLWDAALGETIQGESALGDQGGDVTEAVEEAQFSTRDIPHDETVLENNRTTVQGMKPAVRLVGNEFVMGKQLVKDVAEYYASIGGYSESPIFGRIDLNKRSVKDSVGHGMGPVKAVMYKAVPAVIEMGEMIDYRENWKGRGYDTAMIAAPVEITEGEHKGQYYLGVIVNLYPEKRQRFYVHEAVVVQKKSAPVVQTGTPEGALHGNKDRSFISILEDLNIVNGENQEQYSTRDLPDAVSIREYLGAMKPTSRMTETEKDLLGRYQKKLAELQDKERLAAEQDEIIKTAPATSQELLQAKNRYQVYRQQANRIARELARLERAEGFAGIKATSQTIVNEYLSGATGSGATGSVADAQDALETEIQGLTNRLKVIGNTVEGTAQGQRNAFARGLFNQTELNRAAKQLKDSYNSRMSVKMIADRLALAYGEIYANEGAEGAKRFAEATKELAQDILDSSRYRYRSETLSTIAEEVPTISLTESDLQEIKNAGMTITEYKRGLSPYVKVVEGASDLSSYVTNAENYGGRIGQILGDDTEGNLAMALYNVIQTERASEATATLEGMSESASLGMVLADVVSVNLPMSTSDSTLEYLRKELKKYAGENEQVAQSVDAAIRAAKTATARASAVWREAVKAQGIARQAVEYYRALEEQRRLIELQEQKEMLTEQLKTDAAKKLGEKASKMRQEYREREQRARAYRKTRDEVNKLRRGIGRTVRYLNTRRAHESDQRHIPHEMTKIVDFILSEFTDEKLARLSFSAKQAANLNSLYNKLKTSDTDNTYFWDDEVEDKLRYIYDLSEEYHNLLYDESGKRRPPSLEGYEHEREMLTNIGDVIENIRRMVDAENEIFLEDKDDTFLEYSTNTAKALLERKDVHLLRGAAGDAQKIVNELLWTGNMTPVYFFERLQNDGLLTAFNAVRDGQRKYGRILNEAKKFVLESKERHHYDKWVGEGLLTFETVQGHKITLTREQALWAYATAKREDSLELKKTEHLSKGGFHFRNPREDMGAKGLYRATDKAHQLKAADIQTINNWLTAEQKAYADELVEYLSTTMGDYGNEASLRLYGYKKFREKYYFPFRTWSAQQFQRGDEGSTNTGEASRIKSAGFTKNLTHKANTALEMSDFTDVIGDHIQAMTTYATMVAPVEDIKRLMNHKVADKDDTQSTVRALIGQKYGLASQNYVTDFLRDLNGAVQTDNRAGGGIEKLISTFKRGAVAGSLSVVVQQPTAIFRAMAYVSPKYFSMNRETKNDGKLWKEMLRYSGAAVVKDAGKFDIGLGHSAADWVTGQDIMNPVKAFMRMKEQSGTKAGKEMFDVFKEWMTFLPGFADQVTWKAMWKAVKNEQHALHPEMDTSSEAFLEMCGKRFDDVMDHTQVYDSVLVKSNLMRSKNQLHKMATSFMSEPTLTLNIMIDALKGKHGWKQGAKMFAATVVSQIAAGTLAALVQAGNDDDDERNAKEKLLDRALYNIAGNLNPIEMISYLANIWDTVEGFTVQRSDMEVINDLVTYTKQVANGNLSGWKMVEKLGGTIANIFGVPLGNIMRDFRRGKNAIESEWGKADRENLGFITQENLQWFWADSKKAYYNRMVNAALNGEMEYYEEMMEYMQTSKMADESSIKNGMRGVLKKMVQSGEMTPEEATVFLDKYASYANAKDNTKKPLEWAAEKD